MRILTVLLCALPLAAADPVDLTVVNRIKAEAFEHSKVMDTLHQLTDVHGPRLTASPEFLDAANWALKRLQDYGLSNGHLEKWQFGRSWSLKQFSVEMIEPRYAVVTAWPMAWTANTAGTVAGEAILAPLAGSRFNPRQTETALNEYIEKYKGKLRGKVVLISEPLNDLTASEARPQFHRYTDAELAEIATAPAPTPRIAFDPARFETADPEQRRAMFAGMPEDFIERMTEQRRSASNKRNKFLIDEGVAGVLIDDARAHDGLVFAEAAGGYEAGDSPAPPEFIVTAENYNRIVRILHDKMSVQMRVNLKAETSPNVLDSYNIVADIPGGAKKDEIVMVGAHFDSWHSGTGATDNGAGSAVMMEVVRILNALELKMDRTVRIGLWSGEEEGLLGSKAYVKEHYGDPKTMKITSEHAKLSGYFNLDNGSGKIRGVYLQGNDAMRPLFEQWLDPFKDLGVSTISIRNTGGTDHLSYDAVGLPGFQFIQDPLDYSTVTHHSSMDNYDHLQPGDLMQASAVIASCVYDAATRPDMLPRKPLPKPKTAESSTGGTR